MTDYRSWLILVCLLLFPTMSFAGVFRQLNDDRAVKTAQIVSTLKSDRLLLIGEQHRNNDHHRMQLAIIQALHQSGRKLAIGLEMFYAENQGVLDAWGSGTIRPDLFKVTFEEQWNGWSSYADILLYARDQTIPLVGLNLPRSIVRQVSRNGFDALPKTLQKKTGQVQCIVTPEYAKLLRAVLSNPRANHNDKAFNNFCEAQMMWDTYMAQRIEDYLNNNPDTLLVVIAGSVHSWKQGIPRQFNTPWPMKVLLPSAPGFRALEELTPEDADYIWLVNKQAMTPSP